VIIEALSGSETCFAWEAEVASTKYHRYADATIRIMSPDARATTIKLVPRTTGS
jgi:hypothetical protein